MLLIRRITSRKTPVAVLAVVHLQEVRTKLTAVRVSEVLEELEALRESREDGELAVEGVLAEEEVEDGAVVDALRLPVRVRHRYLVQV